MHRRTFLQTVAAASAGLATSRALSPAKTQLHYLLASSLFGNLPLAEILPVVKQTGATAIDLWPKVHGTQREELDSLGHERFAEMLRAHGLTLGGLTRFDRGPFKLDQEFLVAKEFSCPVIVVGSASRKKEGAKGPEKKEIADFAERLKPVGAKAAEYGVTVAIENHVRALIETPDSLRWLAELAPPGIGIAFAPFHLPQDASLLGGLVRDLGPKLALFYAWQFGQGATKPLPMEEQCHQLPGRGTLDFAPMLTALREINFTGPTEIFMHPTPRGLPVYPTAAATVAEIVKARVYLEGLT